MRDSYRGKSLSDLRRGIKKILRDDIRPYVDADPIPVGIRFPNFVDRLIGIPGLPMERSEY